MNKQLKDSLSNLYRDPSNPGSLGGVERLLKSAHAQGLKHVTRAQVKNYLATDDAYTLHKPIRKHFKRNQTIVGGIDHQWQADLADLSDIARANDGMRYLLTVIDCFSKYAWVIPVKRKDAATTLGAFHKLFAQSAPRKPKRLQTDKGKEFLNSKVQTYLEGLKVKHFTTNSDTKASIVERFNRTLKSRMYTYFSANNTNTYMDVLPQLVKSYNNSVHRTIGMSPSKVTKLNEKKIWNRVYGKSAAAPSLPHKPLTQNETVRISKSKTAFDKGYLPNWTEELFKVKDSVPNRKRVYKLTDFAKEDIAGSFYPEEIQVINKDNDIYLVEKVLKRRSGNSGDEVFVKWKGWPNKFNSWIRS